MDILLKIVCSISIFSDLGVDGLSFFSLGLIAKIALTYVDFYAFQPDYHPPLSKQGRGRGAHRHHLVTAGRNREQIKVS